MKYFILIAITIASFSSYAGGGGGGGVMAAVRAAFLASNKISSFEKMGSNSGSPEILFNISESTESVQFAFGQTQNGQWLVQKFEVSKDQAQSDGVLLKALLDSQIKKTWVKIQDNQE